MTTIRLRQNGPYVIESEDVQVIDWNGTEYAIDRRPIALCRCGASTRKPFCDGTHSKIGFQAGEAAVGPAAQDKPVELRFSHWVPPQHPMHAAAVAWAESIGKASNGTIKVTIYPSQQLGKAFDHYNMARDGIVDISHVNPGYEPGRFPIVAAVELPFIFNNSKEGSAAMDEWYRKYAGKEMKDVRFCLMFAHDPGTFHFTKKKAIVPTDINGMKFRPPNATIASWMRSLGASNVQAAAPEIRDVLEKGVAEGAGAPWGSMGLFGIDKVTSFHIDAPIYVSEQVWVLNPATYAKLSPAQKDWKNKLLALQQ